MLRKICELCVYFTYNSPTAVNGRCSKNKKKIKQVFYDNTCKEWKAKK